jgi:hypothetical protein
MISVGFESSSLPFLADFGVSAQLFNTFAQRNSFVGYLKYFLCLQGG